MRRRPIFASSKTGSETTINEGKYEFKLAWGLVPHPDKAWKGGEDAIYVSSNLLAVADGVGGWSSLGVDAGVYSRQLINIIRELHQNSKDDYYIEHPDKIAIQAVQRNEEKGSATLAILTLHPRTGTLRCYHIGDSIFGLFKRGTEPIVAAEQQTQFNVPYQVHSGKLNALDGSLTLSG